MNISVAMCTYNGAKYVHDQIMSIASQSRLPDELVICDDNSSDETVKIIETFVGQVSFPIRLYKNERNLGSTKNFEKAISLCVGEVIALSDQDDLWYHQKLKLIEEAFSVSPNIGAVFTDADVVDENLHSLGYRLWQSVGFSKTQQRQLIQGKAFEVLLKHNVVTGATMAFRTKYRDLFMPISSDWIHDGWIALHIGAVSKLTIISEPLIQYRQHSMQQCGVMKRGFRGRYKLAKQIKREDYTEIANQYKGAGESLKKTISPDNKLILLLKKKITHMELRARLPENRVMRLLYVLIELLSLRYYRFSGSGFYNAAKDIFHL